MTAGAAVAWLRAQIQGDRDAAEVTGNDDAARTWVTQGHPSESAMIWDGHGSAVVYNEGSPGLEEAAHIALHDPQDVIADCEAKLALLAAHDLPEHYCPLPVLPGKHGQLWTPEEGPCWTLNLLASGYKHRAGYAGHWG